MKHLISCTLLLALLPNLSVADSSLLNGRWQIMSYQIVGYPAMSEAEANMWLGRNVEFTDKHATLYHKDTQQTCDSVTFDSTQTDAEGYFLVGYEVKPARLGVLTDNVTVVRPSCQSTSWLLPQQEFVLISDNQMLSNWEGVFFFFKRDTDTNLAIMPQSVGMIMPKTAFDQAVISQALPSQYQLQQQQYTETVEKPFYAVFQGEERVLDIFPSADLSQIGRIQIYSTQITAPNQMRTGQTYAEIFGDNTTVQCQAELVDTGNVICQVPNMESLQYRFQGVAYTTAEGETLSPEQLQQTMLAEIIWLPAPELVTEEHRVHPQGVALEEEALEMPAETETASTDELTAAYQASDTGLNQAYKQLRDQLNQYLAKHSDETSTKALKVANLVAVQRTWLQFRDNNCRWQAELKVDAQQARSLTCLIRMTDERTVELNAITQQLQ